MDKGNPESFSLCIKKSRIDVMGAAPLDFSEIQEVGHLKTFQDCPITREATVLTSGPGNNHPSFIDLFFIDFFFIDFFFIDIFFIKISLINISFIDLAVITFIVIFFDSITPD